MTRRIVYHLIYEKIDPAAIVAFTFTDKAAHGMKSRSTTGSKTWAGMIFVPA